MGPAKLVKRLLQYYPLEAPPERLQRVLAKTIVQEELTDELKSVEELAADCEGRVRQRLRKELDGLHRLGRPTRISFNSSDQELVQGACFVEPHDSADLRELKRRRSHLGTYLDIVRELAPDEFEILCGRLLEFLGVRSARITRRTADDGIDFYGQISGKRIFLPEDLQPTIQHQLSIWVVGQAKQYIKTRTGTGELRDLLGAVALARSGVSATQTSPVPDLKIRLGDPVFIMLVTGGYFSARVWSVIDKSGVIGIDGELMSAFLADRDVGSGDILDRESFKEWLYGG